MNRGGPHENTMSRLSTKLTLNYGCRLGNSKCLYSESTDKGWLVSAQRDVVWHDVVCLSLAAVPWVCASISLPSVEWALFQKCQVATRADIAWGKRWSVFAPPWHTHISVVCCLGDVLLFCFSGRGGLSAFVLFVSVTVCVSKKSECDNCYFLPWNLLKKVWQQVQLVCFSWPGYQVVSLPVFVGGDVRSEEHTSELQSR